MSTPPVARRRASGWDVAVPPARSRCSQYRSRSKRTGPVRCGGAPQAAGRPGTGRPADLPYPTSYELVEPLTTVLLQTRNTLHFDPDGIDWRLIGSVTWGSPFESSDVHVTMSSCWSDDPPRCGNEHSFWIAYS